VHGRADDFSLGRTTEWPKIETEGREWGWVLGEGQQTPSHLLEGLGSAVSSPSWVQVEPNPQKCKGMPRIFHWGRATEWPKIETEGQEWGGVLGEGQQTSSTPARGSGQCCELRQRGSGWSHDHPKVFHYFQHSGWPLLTLKYC